MRKSTLILLVIFNLFSCSPRIVIKKKNEASIVKDYEGFVVFKEDEPFNIVGDEVCDIEIKDLGFAVNCDYETVLNLAKNTARNAGANCLRVYQHRLPSTFGSSCHRIKAKAYRIKDISPFEKEIIWNAERKLKREDYKGSIENRPFEAMTSSHIKCNYSKQPINGKINFTVENYFDCSDSYFKGTEGAIETLEHEQGHFDITEIYARKLRKAFANQIHSQKDLDQKYENIYRQMMSELQVAQDKYDSEIYPNRSLQKEWTIKIQQDLESLKEFEENDISIITKM